MTNNNNEKETMTQAFSCQDGPKSLKDQGSFVKGLKRSFQGSKKFLLNRLKSSF